MGWWWSAQRLLLQAHNLTQPASRPICCKRLRLVKCFKISRTNEPTSPSRREGAAGKASAVARNLGSVQTQGIGFPLEHPQCPQFIPRTVLVLFIYRTSSNPVARPHVRSVGGTVVRALSCTSKPVEGVGPLCCCGAVLLCPRLAGWPLEPPNPFAERTLRGSTTATRSSLVTMKNPGSD